MLDSNEGKVLAERDLIQLTKQKLELLHELAELRQEKVIEETTETNRKEQYEQTMYQREKNLELREVSLKEAERLMQLRISQGWTDEEKNNLLLKETAIMQREKALMEREQNIVKTVEQARIAIERMKQNVQ